MVKSAHGFYKNHEQPIADTVKTFAFANFSLTFDNNLAAILGESQTCHSSMLLAGIQEKPVDISLWMPDESTQA